MRKRGNAVNLQTFPRGNTELFGKYNYINSLNLGAVLIEG